MLKFKSKQAFFSWKVLTPNPPELGEIAYIEDIDTNYQYVGEGLWTPVEKKKQELDTGLTLYEMNKNIISQMEKMERKLQIEKINESFQVKNLHYMLLCRDINYYSIFLQDSEKIQSESAEFSSLGDAVITCLEESFQEVIFVDNDSNKEAVEIWVKFSDEEILLFMLFDCAPLIIPYREV